MRRPFPIFTAALIFCLLALVLAAPARTGRAEGTDLQEKCDNCMRWVAQRFNQCVAVHGENEVRCYDEFNQGVVICHRNFCEQ